VPLAPRDRQHRTNDAERAEHVHIELALDAFDRCFLDWPPEDVAGVVDDSVDSSLTVDDLQDSAGHCGRVCHIQL
jgi:hypothetical protein